MHNISLEINYIVMKIKENKKINTNKLLMNLRNTHLNSFASLIT